MVRTAMREPATQAAGGDQDGVVETGRELRRMKVTLARYAGQAGQDGHGYQGAHPGHIVVDR